ncbi:MAG TPA: HTTM domain-containing protein [Polyangiaceae bacterium]|nr:HTTM domain-containing protein [Polyangiaceae bacterium]
MSAPWLREAREFWTDPVRGSSAALFRIGYGVLAIWTALGVLLNLQRYYGNRGMLPWSAVQHFPEQRYSLFSLAPTSDLLLHATGAAFLLAAVTLTLGIAPRASALVIFVINIALQHRNPYVVNNGDRLFVILAALGACLPLGQRWSVAAFRKRGGNRPPSRPLVWSQRLIQLQIAYVYLFSCFAKVRHPRWLSGEAVYDVLKSPVFSEWPVKLEFAPLVRVLTWSTLLFELLFPILVWDRRYRRYLLAAGVFFHLGIELTLTIPMFSAIMVVSYACFLSDDETEALVGWLKARVWAPLAQRR